MSNLIKSTNVVSLDQFKELQWFQQRNVAEQETMEQPIDEMEQPDEETVSLRDQILNDAQRFAEDRLYEAAQESEKRMVETEQQIEAWWLSKRAEDQTVTDAAKQSGYELGYADGLAQSEADLQNQWAQKLSEASTVLQSAHEMRDQIIQEAEPFLVELSCAIAEKIIGEQLTISPNITIDLIRKSLSRRREQGVITLCVAPSKLAFVQGAQEELQAAIDSQAQLHILPDSTVTDDGCVIRSAYGSIDATIDTQLQEIKRELLQLAHQSGEERGSAYD